MEHPKPLDDARQQEALKQFVSIAGALFISHCPADICRMEDITYEGHFIIEPVSGDLQRASVSLVPKCIGETCPLAITEEVCREIGGTAFSFTRNSLGPNKN